MPRGAYGESLVRLNADGYRRMTDHLAQKKIETAGGNAKFGQTGTRTPIDPIQLGSRAGILAFVLHKTTQYQLFIPFIRCRPGGTKMKTPMKTMN